MELTTIELLENMPLFFTFCALFWDRSNFELFYSTAVEYTSMAAEHSFIPCPPLILIAAGFSSRIEGEERVTEREEFPSKHRNHSSMPKRCQSNYHAASINFEIFQNTDYSIETWQIHSCRLCSKSFLFSWIFSLWQYEVVGSVPVPLRLLRGSMPAIANLPRHRHRHRHRHRR